MAVYNRQKQLELQEVSARYANYKGLRQQLISQKMLEVEDEMERATLEFSMYLQGMVERTNLPYKITVSDLGRAMGTSNRGTVYKFLGDAKNRREKRYFDDTNLDALGLVLKDMRHSYGMNQIDVWVAVVLDEATNTNYEAQVENLYKTYTVYQVDGDGQVVVGGISGKQFKRPLDDNAPEWLKWLDEQDEWLEKLEEK